MPQWKLYHIWMTELTELLPCERVTRLRNFTWLLATNLDDPQAVLRCYRRRMWIEEMFGDLKGHGVDIESTQLWHFLRLSRLTLAVVLLYCWLVTFGSQTIKSGRRRLVDRNERRDYSIFRIGWNTAERRLINNLSLHVSFDFCL